MSHVVSQIVNRIVALMPTTSRNFKHRVLSLSTDDDELPARSVNLGDDAPLDDDGASNLQFLDSLLIIEIDHKLQADKEEDALEQLIEMRLETHRVLMADRSLGLAFVIDTRYQGADEPERAIKEYVAGVYKTRWLVHYRSNIVDPS